jgi:hypothetical protein
LNPAEPTPLGSGHVFDKEQSSPWLEDTDDLVQDLRQRLDGAEHKSGKDGLDALVGEG